MQSSAPYVRHPIHLQRPARPFERMVTVPRILHSLEHQQVPVLGRHLSDIAFEIGPILQEPQAPARVLPVLVEIEEYCDDLVLAVRVDLPSRALRWPRNEYIFG